MVLRVFKYCNVEFLYCTTKKKTMKLSKYLMIFKYFTVNIDYYITINIRRIKTVSYFYFLKYDPKMFLTVLKRNVWLNI